MNMTELDCRNLNCPMPIVKVSRAIRKIDVGDALKVVATDPAFKPDIEAWVRRMKHRLESFEVEDGVQTALIVKDH